MANENMLMFWNAGPTGWNVWLVLCEKKLWYGWPKFSVRDVTNPGVRAFYGQVPVLKDGEVIISEAGAICMYLEEKYSSEDDRLLPSDPAERAQVYQRMFESANIQSKIIEPLLQYRLQVDKKDWDQQFLKFKTIKANDELFFWESCLIGKKFLVGEIFTLADIFLYPYLALLVRNGATFLRHPNLKQYYLFITERRSVQITWPQTWLWSPCPPILEDI